MKTIEMLLGCYMLLTVQLAKVIW